MTTYLDRIVAAHRAAAANDQRSFDELFAQAQTQPDTHGFRRALLTVADTGEIAVIAEIKRRSPSKGDLAIDCDAAEVARRYELGGAACLSVLTDEDFFAGSAVDLQTARNACSLPVLRKDFTVDARDICDARLMGADCVLLIAAALSDQELREFSSIAQQLNLDVLVEIHDEAELERALAIDANMIGVNQRDLVTFQVDTARAVRMASVMPSGVVRVAESGITGAADAKVLAEAGYHAVLVGEHLVTSENSSELVSALRRARSS